MEGRRGEVGGKGVEGGGGGGGGGKSLDMKEAAFGGFTHIKP